MGKLAGYIPAAVGGHKMQLAHRVHVHAGREARRWRGWWRIVRADQWGAFFDGHRTTASHISHPLIGWNQTVDRYLLAIASPTHPVPASIPRRLGRAIGSRGG